MVWVFLISGVISVSIVSIAPVVVIIIIITAASLVGIRRSSKKLLVLPAARFAILAYRSSAIVLFTGFAVVTTV